jgi:transcriptional regulator with XRE-family HTH domain
VSSVTKLAGTRMRIRRLMLELSQTELADALGTSVQQVRSYEEGSQKISTAHLNQLATVMKVPTTFFLEAANSGKAAMDLAALPFPDEVMDFLTSPDGLLLMAAYTKIKDRDVKRCLVNLVEQVARPAMAPSPCF